MFKRLKNLLIRLGPKAWLAGMASLKLILQGDYLRLRRQVEENERAIRLATTLILQQGYPLPGSRRAKSILNQHEARIYSQNGEDGILLHLFSLLGTRDRHFVEFGVGDGRQCNSANLSLNFGWTGLLMEADRQKAMMAQRYYQQQLGAEAAAVRVLHCRVVKENINQILADNGLSGEIDLLSIDIDGNDYWLWQAIDIIRPRVVVIEYNASLGAVHSLTMPYDPEMNAHHLGGFYHGASLAALTKLARQKGYILVGCESAGVNAFFVHQDVAQGKISEMAAPAAYYPHERRTAKFSQSEQFDQIKHLDFQQV
jgi:hypothetical protein